MGAHWLFPILGHEVVSEVIESHCVSVVKQLAKPGRSPVGAHKFVARLVLILILLIVLLL
jgi:hypothetical protein